MIHLAAANYGALRPVVSGASSVIAAGGAVALSWRSRAKWEPSEEDLSKGPQKVGGLVAAVLIAILWLESKSSPRSHFVVSLTIATTVVCVVALIAYSFLISMQTFTLITASNEIAKSQKIIGGFILTRKAREILRERQDLTVQDLFEGTAFDVDKVWTRPSRAIAKSLFVVCYLALTVSGTVALAGAAILAGG
jgi:hypothetical protein